MIKICYILFISISLEIRLFLIILKCILSVIQNVSLLDKLIDKQFNNNNLIITKVKYLFWMATLSKVEPPIENSI